MRTSRWLSSKESACQCRRCKRRRFDPWVRKVPWRRKWQPTLVFSPWKSHGQRSLWDRVQGVARSWTQQSNYAQQHTYTHTHTHTHSFLNTVYWKDYSISIEFSKMILAIYMWVSFWATYSLPSWYVSVFIAITKLFFFYLGWYQ